MYNYIYIHGLHLCIQDCFFRSYIYIYIWPEKTVLSDALTVVLFHKSCHNCLTEVVVPYCKSGHNY